MMRDKVNLAEKFAKFSEHWHPYIVAEVDDYHVKLAKVQGEFVWHTHDGEDEFFLVIKGEITIKLGDRDVTLREGELFVVAAGIEHMPVAAEEAEVLVLGKKEIKHTGDVSSFRTVENLDWL